MKKIALVLAVLMVSFNTSAQSAKVKKLLKEVSTKMGAYKSMTIGFNSKLINKQAKLDEAPIRGNIVLAGEKYNLDYFGYKFIFDGKQLAVINKEEKEVTISKGDMAEDEDGFIYPSKLITFYNDGYNYKMGSLKTIKGRKIQYVTLTPIDSNSSIAKVLLGIDAKTKHIYKLTQIGKNGAETTFTINNFKSNQPISNTLFTFDKAKYIKQGYLIN